MTLIDTEPQLAGIADEPVPAALAPWTLRAGALAIDILPGVAVITTTALAAASVPLRGTWWWVCVSTGAAAVLWTAFNRLVSPIAGGQSLGRAVFGIVVVHRGGEPVGGWCLVLREFVHLLDTGPAGVGWLWALWDSRGRTFADLLAHTEARPLEMRHPGRRLRHLAAAVMLAAAGLCAVHGAISYFVVHQRDRAVIDASARIEVQGPSIVVRMLSYRPETIESDFDHARSLVSNHYREQLAALQHAALKGAPVRNEYWVTNSSVLDASADRATMLMFLQGERGTPPAQRYISASVRVTFVASGAAGWRVDDLVVVTAPRPAEAKR